MRGKPRFTILALRKEAGKGKTNSKRSDSWLVSSIWQAVLSTRHAHTRVWESLFPRDKSFSFSTFGLKFPRRWNLLDRNAVRGGATCDDMKPPCFASVMPESPQTMISLVANYAAGITTLPRKTGLHYCTAAAQNILGCQEMPATELVCWTVSLGSNLPALGSALQSQPDLVSIWGKIFPDLSIQISSRVCIRVTRCT